MIVFEDDCVGCPTYCINCGRKHSPHYYCDECGDEIYYDDVINPDSDIHYCRDCRRKMEEDEEEEDN